MDLNSRNIKTEAKTLLVSGDRKTKPIMVGLVYVLLCVVFGMLAQRLLLNNFSESEMTRYLELYMAGDYESALRLLERCKPSESAYWVMLLLSSVRSIVSAGFVIFLLNVVRQNMPAFENLLDGFAFFWKILLLYVLEYIFVTLWGLLLVVPGIIASYRYRMAIYLLCEDPSKGPLQCIRESKQMMKGFKGQLFGFDISFIGWWLLMYVPVIGTAVQFYAVPYIEMSRAVWFDRLKNRNNAY